MQEVRGDEQKPHSQGRRLRGELAHDSKAHRYAAYGKCGACAPTVRVLTWGDLRRERRADGDIPGSDHTGVSRSRRCGELPAACDELAATTIGVAARRAATRAVTMQKSAKAIVGRRESGDRRAEQRDTRSRRCRPRTHRRPRPGVTSAAIPGLRTPDVPRTF